MTSKPSAEISAYGSILINSQERLETFKETILNWQEKIDIDMKIRIRGKFSEDAKTYCERFSKVDCVLGSDFIQWRNQALHDVRGMNSKFIMIFLEDHQIIASQSTFHEVIASLNYENIDIFQYSWFEHYENFRSVINHLNESKSKSEILSLSIDLENYNEYVRHGDIYLVSLTSIFQREKLLTLLKTRKPLLRRYDSRGPFDLEKSPKLSFYLPLKFALPVSQFALCVDDEMGIAGSSAISRGLSNLPLTHRGINHYSKLSPRFWLAKFRSQSFSKMNRISNTSTSNVNALLSKLLTFFNVISNTIEFLMFEFLDNWRFFRFKRKFSNK
jgi:hypothetical protein